MKYLSLFSGIGGFEIGLNNSSKDFDCIGYAEIDKYARNIYQRHFDHNDLGDVTKINTSDLPNFDLLVGGFPCQAFSVAGLGKGFDDTRGTLFFEIARILKAKKPKYFLLENVRNLLSHDQGRTFSIIAQFLINLGYNIRWDVLNSKDFGVPQNRERIYIRGSLNSYPNDISLTDGTRKDIKVNYIKNGPQGYRLIESDGVNQTLAASGGNSGGRTFIKDAKIKKIGNHSLSGKGQGGNVYDEEGLSPTLTCQHDYPAKVRIKDTNDFESHIYIDYTYRAITPVECERLQAFPDNWTKYGADDQPISNTQRYKCLGNAVTTTVVKYIIDKWDI